jgi:hypothetical protein
LQILFHLVCSFPFSPTHATAPAVPVADAMMAA